MPTALPASRPPPLGATLLLLGGCAQPTLPALPTASPAPTPIASAISAPPPVMPESIGTAHPYVLVAADDHERWVVLCQAREDTNHDGVVSVEHSHHGAASGDRMRPYLITRDPEGEAIDEFLGADPSDRYLAVARSDRLLLLDSQTWAERDLESLRPDRDPDPSAAMPPRAISFGERVALIPLLSSGSPPTSSAAVVDLQGGPTRTLSLGPGRLWHASVDRSGRWVRATVVPRDSNGNGRLDLPEVRTNRDHGACTSPASYSTFGLAPDGDEIEERWVRIADGTIKSGPRALGPLGEAFLSEAPDGSVVAEAPDGRATTLVPAGCGGPLVAMSSGTSSVIAACKAGWRAFDLGGRSLDLGPADPPEERPREIGATFTMPGGKSEGLLVDLAAWTTSKIPPGFPCAIHGHRLLLDRLGPGDLGVVSFDLDTRKERSVSRLPCMLSHKSGAWVTFGQELYDLEKDEVAGVFPGDITGGGILSLSARGRALMIDPSPPLTRQLLVERMLELTAADRHAHAAPRGPLRWVSASPKGAGR